MRRRSCSAEVIRFLGHLRRLIPGKLLIVWDGAPIHRSKAIRQFLSDGAAEWVHLSASPAMHRRWTRKKASGGI